MGVLVVSRLHFLSRTVNMSVCTGASTRRQARAARVHSLELHVQGGVSPSGGAKFTVCMSRAHESGERIGRFVM